MKGKKVTAILTALLILIILFMGSLIGYGQFFAVALSPESLLYLAALLFFLYSNIYIHEFGHVITAKAMKMGISKVVIGTGRELARKKIFGVPLIITNNMSGGQTLLGHTDRRLLRLRFFIVMSGGILLQLFLTVSLIYLIARDASYVVTVGPVNISNTFIISSIVMIAFNLLPINYKFKGIKLPSDGLRMLKTPFMKEKDLGEILSAGRFMDAHEMFEKKQYDLSAKAYEDILKENPGLTAAKNNLSVIYMKLLELEKAERILTALLGEQREKRYDCLIYNNLAWVHLLYDTEQSLEKADAYSRMAYELNPDMANIRGTRGSALIALGKYNEGIDLLKKLAKLRKPVDPATNNACVFFFLSYAYRKKRDYQMANRYIEHVEKYLSCCGPDEKHIHEILKKKMP